MTWPLARSMPVTGQPRRVVTFQRATSASMYLEEPPCTTRQGARPESCNISWFARNCTRYFAGNSSTSPRRRRPERRAHGHQMLVAKRGAVALRGEVVAEGGTWTFCAEQGARLAVEPQDVADESEEARREEIAALAEEGREGGGVVLEPARLVAHREAHVRRLRAHAELVEHPREEGIVRGIEDDEPGVDAVGAGADPNLVRVGVAAEILVRFVERDRVAPPEKPGTREPRNAGAYDGDPLNFHHEPLSVARLGLGRTARSCAGTRTQRRRTATDVHPSDERCVRCTANP